MDNIAIYISEYIIYILVGSIVGSIVGYCVSSMDNSGGCVGFMVVTGCPSKISVIIKQMMCKYINIYLWIHKLLT